VPDLAQPVSFYTYLSTCYVSESRKELWVMVGLLEQVRLYDEEQAWLRLFVIPEERRDHSPRRCGVVNTGGSWRTTSSPGEGPVVP
jgi:hypothetical protein